jgi:hypothetical protein
LLGRRPEVSEREIDDIGVKSVGSEAEALAASHLL